MALKTRWAALMVTLGLLALAGCAGAGAGADQSFTLMTTARTEFFTQGPSELAPAGYLEAGTRVRQLGSSGGMLQVKTVDGRTGWVASSDVGPQQEPQNWSQ